MPAGINPKRLARLEELYGRAIARHAKKATARDLSVYRDDPVGFAREALEDKLLWSRPIEMMEAVRDHDRVAVRGANSVGKDHTAAELALWWAYAVGGLVLVTGPTQRQVDEIVFGREIRPLFYRLRRTSGVAGMPLTRALRTTDSDEDFDEDTGDLKAGILGFVSTDLSRLTGHHAPRVMCIVTEAQGVADIVFSSMFNNATGERDRILAVANPSEPSGRFYQASQPGSGWHVMRIPAHEHPNVVEGREVIPGGPSRSQLQRIREEEAANGGERSRFWRIFVEAEFPESSTDSLITGEWHDAAIARWGTGAQVGANEAEPVVGLDVARTGGDLCAAAPVRGLVCYPVETWAPAATDPTGHAVTEAERVMRKYGGRPAGTPEGPARGRFVVDVALMGGGVVDGLRRNGWEVVEFNGAATAYREQADEPTRYANDRGYGYWTLRLAFQAGTPVLAPGQEALRQELVTIRYEAGPRDAIKMLGKPELRTLLHRSPDRADALMMAWLEANGAGSGGLAATGECGV